MYTVDGQDRVLELEDVPQCSVGAPLPVVLSNEHSLLLAYYVQNPEPGWDGTTIRIVDHRTSEEPVAVIEFSRPYAMMFGPPNDEAFSGHPLASRGLGPYNAYKVENSSWIRSLERMNAVHPYHRPEKFHAYSHFIFAFHDSTFECIATGYVITSAFGPLDRVVDSLRKKLGP
jgi:hypothetical protein